MLHSKPRSRCRLAIAAWLLGSMGGPLLAQNPSLPVLPAASAAPSLAGASAWLNSPPLDLQALRGKVVLVDFWTYSCINCLRSLPYVKAWYQRYHRQGLVVIGVHSPEFAFEHSLGNIRAAIKRFGIDYPVAVDNDDIIWNAYHNQYWPAHYFIDARGRLRYRHYGEGDYARSEQVIRILLREAGAKRLDANDGRIAGTGIEQAAAMNRLESPETYLGYARAERFAANPPLQMDRYADYQPPATLALNQWALEGQWRVGAQRASLGVAGGRLHYRFRARDLHLVLSPAAGQRVAHFKVLIDGHPPGADHGVDVAPDGSGAISGQRLYQLIRQRGAVQEHDFSIQFLESGVSVYAVTFG